MREDLRELYQAVIVDHARTPRNFRHPEHATYQAQGHNPMCGDQLSVYLSLDTDGVIEDAAFQGNGCAISLASASLMTELLRGRSAGDALRLQVAFQALCTSDRLGEETAATEERQALESLRVLSGVRAFPGRVTCAILAWHTMAAALRGNEQAGSE
jgi:nitrogen fixation NifU-like protein